MFGSETGLAKAQAAFDELSPADGNIDVLHLRALAVYDAEIAWYESAARKRRAFSVVIRWAAVIAGGLGAILLELAAFGDKEMARAAVAHLHFGNANAEPAAFATMFLVIAGLILLTDRVLLINRNFVQYRVMQFKLRSLRADFSASFIETLSASSDAPRRALFARLHILSAKSLKALADEIEAETEAWQASFNEGLAALSKRFEKELPSARTQIKEAQEEAKNLTRATQRSVLNVKVRLKDTNGADRTGDFIVLVDGATPEEAATRPGATRSFSVTPGLRTIALKSGGKVVESIGIEVAPNKIHPTIEI